MNDTTDRVPTTVNTDDGEYRHTDGEYRHTDDGHIEMGTGGTNCRAKREGKEISFFGRACIKEDGGPRNYLTYLFQQRMRNIICNIN